METAYFISRVPKLYIPIEQLSKSDREAVLKLEPFYFVTITHPYNYEKIKRLNIIL